MSNINQIKQEICPTKDKIIKIAENLFSKFNYLAVTMDDIANMLKITKHALYYHFKSKEDLFIEMTKKIFQNFSSILDEILIKKIPLEEKFKELSIAYMNFSLEKRDLGRLMMQKFSKKDKKIIKLMREFKQIIIKQIEPLVKDILILKGRNKNLDSRLITLFLIGALNTLVASKMTMDSNNWKVEQAVDQITSLIFFTNK